MLIVVVASVISMSAGEVRGTSISMEAGDLGTLFCLECATAYRGWWAPPVVRARRRRDTAAWMPFLTLEEASLADGGVFSESARRVKGWETMLAC